MQENTQFGVGDLVAFNLDENETYSYNVPKLGTIGVIEVQTHSFGLEQMLGIKIPMSVVQWADGQKIAVFSHDLRKLEPNQALVNKLKGMSPYTGEDLN